MTVKSVVLDNFRNIKNMVFEPCEGINVIYGENAQGKTNLIESIWLFSGFKSFRGSKDNDLISFGEDFLKLNMDFYGAQRDQNAKIIINRQMKRIILNSVPLTASSRLIGNFNCVVFSPSYLSVVKGNPSDRRKFIDAALCQIKPNYAKLLNEYKKTVDQRNSYLKSMKYSGADGGFLDIWNEKTAELSSTVINYRLSYLESITNAAENIFCGLSSSREKLTVGYSMRISPNRYRTLEESVSKEEIVSLLENCQSSDIMNGSTEIGAHRDEIDIKIDSKSAKMFGSQGQQRSAALSLKLGEAEVLKDKTEENPVILLDDVMSELDVNRQNYILNHIKDKQVFITCCEPSTVLRLCKGKTFKIEEGKIKEE